MINVIYLFFYLLTKGLKILSISMPLNLHNILLSILHAPISYKQKVFISCFS